MSFLLDTNALSEVDKPLPDQGFMRWFNHATVSDLYVSCITFGELYKGIELLADIPKRKQLQKRTATIVEEFGGRILIVDLEITLHWARLMAGSIKKGKTAPSIDALIAAQCLYYNLTLITRNIKDFEQFPGLKVQCPWSNN